MKKLLLYFSLWSLISCSWFQEEIPLTIEDKIIQDAAQERINRYLNRKMKLCRTDILKDAEAYVDSIIATKIDQYLLDTLYYPVKPNRPEFPSKVNIDTSFKVKPLFDSVPDLKKQIKMEEKDSSSLLIKPKSLQDSLKQ